MKILSWALLFAIVAIVGWVIWAFIGVFHDASDNIKVVSIASIISVATFITGKYLEENRKRRDTINSERIVVYKRFIDLFYRVILSSKDGFEKIGEQDLAIELSQFKRDLLFWGSDNSIKCWFDLESSMNSAPKIPSEIANMLKCMGRLMKQMRIDVGYRFTNIEVDAFARMILRADDNENRETLKIMSDKKK